MAQSACNYWLAAFGQYFDAFDKCRWLNSIWVDHWADGANMVLTTRVPDAPDPV